MGKSNSLIYRKGVYQDEKGRDYYFDNAKFILIFLVVLAHALSPLKTGNAFLTYLWRVINTFHMPAMIFISGYFAKRYFRKDGINVQRPFNYLILFLASHFAVRLFEYFVLRDKVGFSPLSPASSLWFLLCLIWWYMMLPVLDRFRPRYVMIFAILLGLICGYDNRISNYLALSRVFVHMPFFMAGYYIDKGKIERLFTKKARLLAVPALAVPLAGFVLLGYHPTPWLEALNLSASKVITCSYNYWDMTALKDYSVPAVTWWVPRLLFYISAVLLGFGFFTLLVPRSWNCFTRFGSRTLQVYILHRFLYLADLKYEWWKPFKSTGGIIAMAGIALLVTIVLSFKPFQLPFDALNSIKAKGLMRTREKIE